MKESQEMMKKRRPETYLKSEGKCSVMNPKQDKKEVKKKKTTRKERERSRKV